jgi:N6-adenosine-specific RNA methylase IME4
MCPQDAPPDRPPKQSREISFRRTDELCAHADASLVPSLPPAEAAALAADILVRGILSPFDVTAAGVVLDGHERLRAARELGLREVPVRIVAPSDERSYILLAALRRKHLNPGQRAAIGLDLDEVEQERQEARDRQRANLKQNTEVASSPPRGERTRDRVAQKTGVSPRTVQDAETLRTLDTVLYEQMKQGAVLVSNAAQIARRERRYAEIGRPPPLPAGQFDLLYADPPWQLGSPDSEYAPENYYPTLPLDEIKALAVPSADQAVLYLWAVNRVLPAALEVMAAWGFGYRSLIVWVKQGIGLGVWVRHRHELLLIGIKGGFPPPAPKLRPDSVIKAPRTRHSEKPAVFYEVLERSYPKARRLELFARSERTGWSAWGNEVGQ